MHDNHHPHDPEIGSRLAGKRWEIKDVKINDLIHDLACQQPRRDGKVRDMLRRGFDPALANFPTVSERANGEQRILDGATRCGCALRSGMEVIKAIVWYDLSPEDESWLFAYLNKKTNPPALYTFRSRFNSGEPIPNAIVDCLFAHGWELSEGGTADGNFAAVVMAEAIYLSKSSIFRSKMTSGPELFAGTIAAVTEAWGHSKDAVDNQIIGGMAAFLARYWDLIDDDRLVAVLQQHKPVELKAGGLMARKMTDLPATLSQAWNIHQLYNKKLRGNKLPAFVV